MRFLLLYTLRLYAHIFDQSTTLLFACKSLQNNVQHNTDRTTISELHRYYGHYYYHYCTMETQGIVVRRLPDFDSEILTE